MEAKVLKSFFCAPRLAAACVLVMAAARCGPDEDPPFDLPALSSSHAVFGTTAAGQPVSARALRLTPVGATAGLRPEFIGGGDVDFVWAGLDASDLPAGLGPEAVVFQRLELSGTRPLPPLEDPHVLRAPSPPDRPQPLVPIDSEGLPDAVQTDRASRFEAILSNVGLVDPCRAPATPWTVWTPRIPSEAAVSARAMSDGSTIVGLTTTSTAVLGSLVPGRQDVALLGVGIGADVVPPGSRATVRALDGAEVTHPSGRRVPAAVSLAVQSGFGTAASVWLWSNGAWREDTPLLPEALPRSVRGLRRLPIDGVPSLCAFGTAQGGARPATAWCRPDAGGDWRVELSLDARIAITAVSPLTGGGVAAADLGGTVYVRTPTGWSAVFESAVNAGCEPPCTTIGHALERPSPTGADLWLAGDDVQLLQFSLTNTVVRGPVPQGLNAALFKDERADASLPANFRAATVSPDGALWLATDRRVLLRYSPSGDVERVCLPDAFDRSVDVGAAVAHEDGRLLVIGSPVLVAQSAW